MNEIYSAWLKTALIPTSFSGSGSLLALLFVSYYPETGSLTTLALIALWLVVGVPLTFLCTSVATVFLSGNKASIQLQTGIVIALLTPPLAISVLALGQT